MNDKSKNFKNQAGFTLVEIAIVLVIIGLLLGGVMKGQELITGSKVKNAAKDLDGVASAYHGYVDRYRRLPGDDGLIATLQARGGAWANVTRAGDNNGVIVSAAATTFTGATVESDGFWQHLKAAGFLTGNPADQLVAALPRNAFGGLIGVTNALVMPVGVGGLTGDKVCMSQVPGKAAQSLDTQLDDGLPTTGSVRATDGVVGANTAPGAVTAATAYNENNQYTICRQL